MHRLPVLVRQNKVFEQVVAGKNYQQICKSLDISEDTVARDMADIAAEVQKIVRERHGELLAIALAHYQAVVDEAWKEFRADRTLENKWWDGKLDYPVTERSEKTLETKALDGPMTERDEYDDDLGAIGDALRGMDDPFAAPGAAGEVSKPLEVRTKISTVRPAYKSQRAQWLKLIIEATREITELTQIKTLSVQLSGTVVGVGMTLEEWLATQQHRRGNAEETLNLLDESDDA